MQEQKTSYPKHKIKVLLLEGIHQKGIDYFAKEGFQVEALKDSLSTEELKLKIADVHLLGIRSKTKITKEILDCAKRLKAIGCFCIGTDTVDLDYAETLGIPVFNSPFLNTRSVAELVLAEIIFLARRIGDRSMEIHKGIWNKTSVGCFEIRNKTLFIVGYGHVGMQVSLMAESMGMSVIYFDIVTKLPLGNAKSVSSLEEGLKIADFVTLHVPKTPETNHLITQKELSIMKKGSYLLNLSRGTVVNISDLAQSLKEKHLSGAAVDVYPEEPLENYDTTFVTPLQGLENVILTPHIGGSTKEAQLEIGIDVARKLTLYLNLGTTDTAVNFPHLTPRDVSNIPEVHRIVHIHPNKSGVLRKINEIVSHYNINAQLLATSKSIGYLIVDLDQQVGEEVFAQIKNDASTIKARILY